MSETSEADPADRKLELDAKRLQVEIANLSLDNSSPNEWETGILSAAVTLPSLNVLELFISHPERFDPLKFPDTARQNLTALAVSAPEYMKRILREREGSLRHQVETEDKTVDQATIRAALDAVTAALQATE